MPARVAKEPLSRARVLQAGVAIADEQGLPAVTMRGVADRLECEAMSLYHHVSDKRALLSGMVEVVADEVLDAALAVPDSADWRAAVRGRCLAARRVALRHPWAPAVVATETAAPPALMPLYEQLVGTLVGAGFTYDLAHRAIHALGSRVLGFSTELFDAGPEPTEPPSPEMLEQIREATPHLARLAGMDLHDREGAIGECDTQAEFEFVLDLVLEGLERLRPTP
ncbi:TetR/AcrR family transcriptional regulator [Phycicoccus sp. CSK15P-2]|uniref:TetR/AcrR family transcriptional regulator n=1 Tax=Phycicoccus sp. CSK15P-2 TaxID=2807627 RepID=UPI0019518AD3|nr:TetR/AcrR family transcriptional regulator [Phycicoccus sp. CSK15P-2]MBM6406146.1 TetR/AcrR family transcriptional regulator [Phycicoccus sp. CSK15P-2]